MANIPEDLHYSKDHEWVRVEGNVAVVGITDYAQDSLGDVVYVELPKPGEEFAANESFGSVESVKAVSEVFSPVSGKVVANNETLNDEPEKVNQDPYGEGWMIRVEMSNPGEVDSLLTAAEYEDFTKGETE
jgi:glycine cleavage system H protein